MKKIIFIVPLFFQFLTAQNNNETLFTIDNESVSVAEFERVYTKNNINNQADYSKASLDEYLNLFVNFKLKVKEAEMLQMDTIPSIKQELESYKVQLVKNYANDKEVTEELIKEAYERSQYEVNASHILVLWPNSYPSAADSAKTLKAINLIKKKATPKNFNELAKTSSQDPSAKDNGGNLSYLTVFQTVYPFENALYSTKVGEISEPIATQFGYHLVFVHDKRPARGKIKTAHILIKSKETDSDTDKATAQQKAQSIYNELIQGTINFEAAVPKYSEDAKTKFKAGKLPELSSAEMLSEFGDAAFALENDNEFSKPIKTPIGWHIIKRLSKTEVPAFEDAEQDLAVKVNRDSRSNVALEKNIEDSKLKFGFSQNKASFNEVEAALIAGNITDVEKYNKEIFTIGEQKFFQKDFINYTQKNLKFDKNDSNRASKIKSVYNKFQGEYIQKYRETHLAEINEDYKNLMQEYHDGILLFELTNNEVWSKAVADTVGLKTFHEANKNNYMWADRADVSTYSFQNDKAAQKGIKFLEKGKNSDFVLSKLNKKENLVKVKKLKVEKENFNNEELEWLKGSNSNKTLEDGSVQYTIVNEILSPMPKALNETKGYVISDYQNYLEKEWIANLKNKYKVEVNNQVFQSLIK